MVFFHSYVKLPEGSRHINGIWKLGYENWDMKIGYKIKESENGIVYHSGTPTWQCKENPHLLRWFAHSFRLTKSWISPFLWLPGGIVQNMIFKAMMDGVPNMFGQSHIISCFWSSKGSTSMFNSYCLQSEKIQIHHGQNLKTWIDNHIIPLLSLLGDGHPPTKIVTPFRGRPYPMNAIDPMTSEPHLARKGNLLVFFGQRSQKIQGGTLSEVNWTLLNFQWLPKADFLILRMPSAFQRFRGFRSSEAQQNPKNGQFCDFVEFFKNFSAPVFLAFVFIVFGFLAAAGFDGRLLSTLCSCQNGEEQQRNPTLNNQQPQEQGTEEIAGSSNILSKNGSAKWSKHTKRTWKYNNKETRHQIPRRCKKTPW